MAFIAHYMALMNRRKYFAMPNVKLFRMSYYTQRKRTRNRTMHKQNKKGPVRKIAPEIQLPRLFYERMNSFIKPY